MEIIGKNSEGPAVEDVQRRLVKLGYDLGECGVDGLFLGDTAAAVRAFRKHQGLPEGDTIDGVTWAALVDASFSLGDRTLYLRMPYFHGNDVAELQHILNILGFACGEEDAIFGAYTERAVRDFQMNMGIEPDGIVGLATFKALARLHHAWNDKNPLTVGGAGLGFSRAAEVLETTPVCVYGVDDASREIAARISNLAFATTTHTKVTSADMLSSAPEAGTLRVEITSGEPRDVDGTPVVVFDSQQRLGLRFKTAVSSLESPNPRIIVKVVVPTEGDEDAGGLLSELNFGSASRTDDPKGWRRTVVQHYAIIILDAICGAYARP